MLFRTEASQCIHGYQMKFVSQLQCTIKISNFIKNISIDFAQNTRPFRAEYFFIIPLLSEDLILRDL